jgi:hypothetical protein
LQFLQDEIHEQFRHDALFGVHAYFKNHQTNWQACYGLMLINDLQAVSVR